MKNYFALIMALLFVSVNCHGAATERFIQIHEDSSHVYSMDKGSVTCVKHPRLKDVHIISAWVKKCPKRIIKTNYNQTNEQLQAAYDYIKNTVDSLEFRQEYTVDQQDAIKAKFRQIMESVEADRFNPRVGGFETLEEAMEETAPTYKHTLIQYRFQHPSRTYSVASKIYVSEAGQKPDSDGDQLYRSILPESVVEKTYAAATEQAFKWSFSKWLGL